MSLANWRMRGQQQQQQQPQGAGEAAPPKTDSPPLQQRGAEYLAAVQSAAAALLSGGGPACWLNQQAVAAEVEVAARVGLAQVRSEHESYLGLRCWGMGLT